MYKITKKNQIFKTCHAIFYVISLFFLFVFTFLSFFTILTSKSALLVHKNACLNCVEAVEAVTS